MANSSSPNIRDMPIMCFSLETETSGVRVCENYRRLSTAGSSDVSVAGGSGVGCIGLSWSMGMTKVHTSGLQSFQTSWSVTEQYYGARSSVSVKANPTASQATYQVNTDMFTRKIVVYGMTIMLKFGLILINLKFV